MLYRLSLIVWAVSLGQSNQIEGACSLCETKRNDEIVIIEAQILEFGTSHSHEKISKFIRATRLSL